MSENGKATFGLDENVAAGLSYLTFIAGIIFAVSEKENKKVRFNAWQCLFLAIATFAISIVLYILMFIPGIGVIAGLLSTLVGLAYFITWIVLLILTITGKDIRLPVLADMADKRV